eukprot:2773632-Pyramimonas_sp.AAC.1
MQKIPAAHNARQHHWQIPRRERVPAPAVASALPPLLRPPTLLSPPIAIRHIPITDCIQLLIVSGTLFTTGDTMPGTFPRVRCGIHPVTGAGSLRSWCLDRL